MSFRTMAAIWLVHSMLVQITLIFIVNKKRNGKKKKRICVCIQTYAQRRLECWTPKIGGRITRYI